MSQIPNPFLAEDKPQQHPSRALTSQDFLLMTPVSATPTTTGRHRGGKNRGRWHFTSPWRSPPQAGNQGTGFIPISSGEGHENSASKNQDRRGRGGGPGGGPFQGGHRYSYPYQHTPQQQNQGFSPQRHGFGHQRHHSNGGDRNERRNVRKLQYGSKREDRAPLSSVPIEKFISSSMVADPWSEFSDGEGSDMAFTKLSPMTLDDSEIIIDSDASVIVESSYEEGQSQSGNEGDSSPFVDTGSDSPHIATPSTSEKDTGSDSLSDA
ncbi:uncharacterized protein LOC143039473 [Oratosquilla oratoria]|uniref:uncharacterized protein LOC143039473 n=1 Tax=Oratosquilla oratoria TaxID=337810 RepID=UPI003F7708CE